MFDDSEMRAYARDEKCYQGPQFSWFNVKINQFSKRKFALKAKEGFVDKMLKHSDLALFGPRFYYLKIST